jgi:hypothetical protein
MKRLAGLQAIAIVFVLLCAALLILAALISQGVTFAIVPPPGMPAEGLVRALKAHRYEGALEELSEELQQQVQEQDLRDLAEKIEQAHQGIEQVHGETVAQQEQDATAQVDVELDDGSQQTIELPLKKENGIWKVTSLDPLNALTQ